VYPAVGVAAAASKETLADFGTSVADAKLRHPAANPFDLAGHVEPENVVFRPRKSHSQPDDERLAPHEHSISGVD
jgi:hypothetical protein